MPTVLLIVYDYPPGYQVGHTRIVAFEKYLPQFGFQTVVLTTRSYGVLPTDRERRVYRAWDAGPLYLPLTRRFLPSPRRGVSQPVAASSWRRAVKGCLETMRSWGMSLFVPDLQITWLPGALCAGLWLCWRKRPDLLYSSSPPETAHLVAGLLATLTHIPWVADFRDGWMFESLKPLLRREGWRSRLERRLERWAVMRASAVVTVSEPITDYFRQTYPDSADRCYTITNGYDPDDWRDVCRPPRDSRRFRLVFTGAFSHSRPSLDPQPFLRGLAALPPEVRAHMEVVIVGVPTESERQLVTDLGLTDMVQLLGQRSKSESLQYQLSADVLVLIAGVEKSVATSKLYEYLYAQRPILVLAVPDNAAAQIVTQTRTGVVVDPMDSTAIAAALTRLYEQWCAGTLSVQPRGIEVYHRRNLARQLADVFSAVLVRASRR